MYNRSVEEISNFIGLLLKFSRRSADSKPGLYYLLPKVCVPEVISTSISISWGFFFTRCYHTRPNIFDIAKILFHKMHFNAILVISLLQNRLRITSSFKICTKYYQWSVRRLKRWRRRFTTSSIFLCLRLRE